METNLALPLTTHTSQDKPSLINFGILAGDCSHNTVDEGKPASEVWICRAIHKPVLVSYVKKVDFSTCTIWASRFLHPNKSSIEKKKPGLLSRIRKCRHE